MADALVVVCAPQSAVIGLAGDLLQGAPAIAEFTGMTQRQVRYRGEIKAAAPDNPRLWPIWHDGCGFWASKAQLLEYRSAGRYPAAGLPSVASAA
jgi:hypothetical protein